MDTDGRDLPGFAEDCLDACVYVADDCRGDMADACGAGRGQSVERGHRSIAPARGQHRGGKSSEMGSRGVEV